MMKAKACVLIGALALLGLGSLPARAALSDKWCVGPNDDLCLDSNVDFQIKGSVVVVDSITAAFFIGNGASLTNVVKADSVKQNNVEVEQFFVSMSTVTLDLRGGLPLFVHANGFLKNNDAGGREYTIRISKDGSALNGEVETFIASGEQAILSSLAFEASSSSGIHTYAIQIKSDGGAAADQLAKEMTLVVREN